MNYYYPIQISNAYATPNQSGNGSGFGDVFNKFSIGLKAYWPMILGASALNLFLVGIKFAQGPIATLWTIGGIIGFLLGGYGAISSGFTINGKPIFGGLARSNYTYPYPHYSY